MALQDTGELFGIETTAILSAPGAVVVVSVVTVVAVVVVAVFVVAVLVVTVAVVVCFGMQNIIDPAPVSISCVSHLCWSQQSMSAISRHSAVSYCLHWSGEFRPRRLPGTKHSRSAIGSSVVVVLMVVVTVVVVAVDDVAVAVVLTVAVVELIVEVVAVVVVVPVVIVSVVTVVAVVLETVVDVRVLEVTVAVVVVSVTLVTVLDVAVVAVAVVVVTVVAVTVVAVMVVVDVADTVVDVGMSYPRWWHSWRVSKGPVHRFTPPPHEQHAWFAT